MLFSPLYKGDIIHRTEEYYEGNVWYVIYNGREDRERKVTWRAWTCGSVYVFHSVYAFFSANLEGFGIGIE